MVVAAIAAFPNRTMAQSSSADTPVSAKIITPLTLVEKAPMAFGTIGARLTESGTVVLDTDGKVTTTGTIAAQGGVTGCAAYTVEGNPGFTYSVELPTTFNVTFGSNTMQISDLIGKLTSKGVLHQGSIIGQLDSSGADQITIGATLTVVEGQPVGEYAGTFHIAVVYN